METARALAAHSASVVLAARDEAKLQQAVEHLRGEVPGASVDVVVVDLADLASVRAAAGAVAARHPVIDLLIDNAGVMACPLGRTVDGFETQFGTNHLGHFVFTTLLHDPLAAAAAEHGSARVVVLSSGGHRLSGIRWDDPNWEHVEEYFNWTAYGQSKTANALFALELDRRWAAERIHAFSVHPGMIAAELDAHGGAYLENCGVADPVDDPDATHGVRSWARDPVAAARLWDLSEQLVGSA